MLAKKRSLKLNGVEIERTPLLVPSFSSKGFPQAREIVRYSSELIEGPALVSAYDLYYNEISPPFDFASLIFLDSGGYEASKDIDLSDFEERAHKPDTWTPEFHREVLEKWNPQVPSVLISYDHPKERVPLAEQIQRAPQIAPSRTDVLREILLKPETVTASRLVIQNVVKNIHQLADFDIIGVTEKEIGSSILERMKNLGHLRKALDRVGLDTPIHVFGSLDTITTPMYFLAGADIFDGLTWLRFAYHDGRTLYKQNYGATVGISTKSHVLDGICWNHNYRYLQGLQLQMRRYLGTENFESFEFNSNLFKTAIETAMEQIGAEDGR